MTPGRGPFLQRPVAPQGLVHLREAPGAGGGGRPRRALAHPHAGWRLLWRPLHPERGAEIPGHHRIPAAAGVSVEPQQRRRLEGEHRKTRHEAVVKARASGPDRIGDAVETLSHRLQHPGHPQMPAEGFFLSCSRPVLPRNGRFRAKRFSAIISTHCRTTKNKTGGNHCSEIMSSSSHVKLIDRRSTAAA